MSPDPKDEALLVDALRHRFNTSKEMLSSMMAQTLQYLMEYDDSWVIVTRSYGMSKRRPPTPRNDVGFVVPHAAAILPVGNTRADWGVTHQGIQLYVCPNHRQSVHTEKFCPTCEKMMLPARAVSRPSRSSDTHTASQSGGSDRTYYAEGEVFGGHGWINRSRMLGVPGLLPLMPAIQTLYFQTLHQREYFDEDATPASLLAVRGDKDNFYAAMTEYQLKRQENPVTRKQPVLHLPDRGDANSKGNMLERVSLRDSLETTEFSFTQTTLTNAVYARYGLITLRAGTATTDKADTEMDVAAAMNVITEMRNFINEEYLRDMSKALGATHHRIWIDEESTADKTRRQREFAEHIGNYSALQAMGAGVGMKPSGRLAMTRQIPADFMPGNQAATNPAPRTADTGMDGESIMPSRPGGGVEGSQGTGPGGTMDRRGRG